MTINDLKLFVAVYKSNSLLQAAAIHGTSEPNVSRCIRMLEKEYHTVLFERVGKRLEPTEVGKTFYTHTLFRFCPLSRNWISIFVAGILPG